MRNVPFTHTKVKKLDYGFNSSGPFMNRRSRKSKFKNLLPVDHYQIVRIKDKKTKEYLVDRLGHFFFKLITHYKTPPKLGLN